MKSRVAREVVFYTATIGGVLLPYGVLRMLGVGSPLRLYLAGAVCFVGGYAFAFSRRKHVRLESLALAALAVASAFVLRDTDIKAFSYMFLLFGEAVLVRAVSNRLAIEPPAEPNSEGEEKE